MGFSKAELDLYDELVPSKSGFAILLVLDRKDSHGLEIIRTVMARFEHEIRKGSIYSELYEMKKAGLIVSRECEPAPGERGPTRVVYSLSERGRLLLRRAKSLVRACL